MANHRDPAGDTEEEEEEAVSTTAWGGGGRGVRILRDWGTQVCCVLTYTSMLLGR